MTKDKFLTALGHFAAKQGYSIALVADPNNPSLVGAYVIGDADIVEQLTVDFSEVDILTPPDILTDD
jgi:hypothetical protein